MQKLTTAVGLFEEKHQAKREAEQLRLLVHGTTEYAIFMLDPEGHVVTWNPGAERIKGYRAEEIMGQHFSRFYPPEAEKDRCWPEHELEVARSEGRFEDEGWRVRKPLDVVHAQVLVKKAAAKVNMALGCWTRRKAARSSLPPMKRSPASSTSIFRSSCGRPARARRPT